MAFELAKLFVRLRADSSGLNKDLRKSEQRFKQVGRRLAAAFSVAMAVRFARDSIQLAERQIEAETRLAAVLKATGNAAGFTSKQLQQYASNLQKATTFGDEEILESMAVLASFRKVSGDVFKRATEAAMDVSVTMKQDLRSSVLQLAKALEDPVKNMGALSRAGTTFTKEQQELIKGLVESNRLLEAQEFILGEVESQYGGVSRAIAGTDFGQLKQINNELGDMKETLGKEIIPLVVDLKQNMLALFRQIHAGLPTIKAFAEQFGAANPEARRLRQQLTGIDTAIMVQRFTELFGDDPGIRKALEARRSQVNRRLLNALERPGLPAAPDEIQRPRAGASPTAGRTSAGNVGAGFYGIAELGRVIQESLLQGEQDRMLQAIEAGNRLQEQQLQEQQRINRNLRNNGVPARVAPG